MPVVPRFVSFCLVRRTTCSAHRVTTFVRLDTVFVTTRPKAFQSSRYKNNLIASFVIDQGQRKGIFLRSPSPSVHRPHCFNLQREFIRWEFLLHCSSSIVKSKQSKQRLRHARAGISLPRSPRPHGGALPVDTSSFVYGDIYRCVALPMDTCTSSLVYGRSCFVATGPSSATFSLVDGGSCGGAYPSSAPAPWPH